MYQASFISSIHDINPHDWNQLCPTDYPFIRHEFFSCLEDSGCTSIKTGWQPHHLIVTKNGSTIIAIVPLFIKYHSYGEYIFDWAWAQAYQRHGINYYPKLLNAIPFTPATGPRWLINKNFEDEELLSTISRYILTESNNINTSSCHCLFTTEDLSCNLEAFSWQQRTSYQYHWFNKNYSDFDNFLSEMISRKRKNITKERKKIKDQDVSVIVKEGKEITKDEWHTFYLFYKDTYAKRSGHAGYLSFEFFLLLGERLADTLVMIKAESNSPNKSAIVAAALFFKDSETLYGRYWGCHQYFDSLHFELCYYQGIEYAIKHQLKKFDAGAQGEHKIQRGFVPVPTWSNHWIKNEGFKKAINDFILIEAKEVEHYIQAAKESLPFKACIKK